MWQDAAYAEWRARLMMRVPGTAALVAALAPSMAVQWLRRLAGDPHPVAAVIGRWLSDFDGRHGRGASPQPGYGGRHRGRSGGASRAPGWRRGMGALWAGCSAHRWQSLASFLGPVAMLGALEGRVDGPAIDDYLASCCDAYAPYLARWSINPVSNSAEDSVVWPEAPDYGNYQEQLTFGVVPHEVGGEGISSEAAVPIALSEMLEEARPTMAGLSYKALEGLWMAQVWQRVR